MRSVIVCEGRDDLWFISYYLHKALKWDECDASLWCKSNIGVQGVQTR